MTGQDDEQIIVYLEKRMRTFAKGKTFNPDNYICFAPKSVIATLRYRGNTKSDVIIAGHKVRCRVGSYPEIQRRTTGVRR